MPLTPKFFLSRQKGPFCSDHIGEKIIIVRFLLDFLWIFKTRKIRATVVHGRVARRMGRVRLWRQPGKRFHLERWWESEDTADQRSQRDCSEEKLTTVPYRCVAANCHNVVNLSKCIFVHNIPTFGDQTTIPWKYNRPSGNRFKQQFLRNMPWSGRYYFLSILWLNLVSPLN